MKQAPVLSVEFYDPSSKRHLIVTSIHSKQDLKKDT
ncbi:hypothetical protein FOTG_17312 [Fusarium oxysporum f. sp. vasinfectum 25433]|uniref:Uncharacterized protein n=1 Tax=Fusarium oxysporum f. sp. vasinfectum 25433 TaxID=1089449 RepID=X0KZQ1_FUSOX|nr:hypothetical protein FOTG_17312 [Fusarium oxysporum f. sp. vasinfectum 25433]